MRFVRQFIPAPALAAGIGLAAVAGAAAAEQVFVQKPSAVVREDKGNLYKEVATVAKGTPLTVLERDGRWLRVKAPSGGEGWVFDAAVTAKRTGPGLGDVLGSNADAGAAAPAAAGKGLEPEAIAYADNEHLDRSPLARLVAARKALDPEQLRRFMAEGKVGEAKP
jgi:hypothetical protein